MTTPTMGRKGQWTCEGGDGIQRHKYLVLQTLKEEKEHPLLQQE